MLYDRKYCLVLFTGHVGSSAFVSSLSSHPDMEQIGFEPIDEMRNASISAASTFSKFLGGEGIEALSKREQKIITKKFQQQSAADGLDLSKPAFCLKSRARLDAARFFTQEVPKMNPLVVNLRRKNILKNAVSSYKRHHLKISHLKNFEKNDEKRKPVQVEPEKILSFAKKFLMRDLHTSSFSSNLCKAANLQEYKIYYEEFLVSGLEHSVHEVWRLLDLAAASVEVKYKKMTPNSLQEAVENYDELEKYLRGTIFEGYLKSDDYEVSTEEARSHGCFPESQIIQAENIFDRLRSQ